MKQLLIAGVLALACTAARAADAPPVTPDTHEKDAGQAFIAALREQRTRAEDEGAQLAGKFAQVQAMLADKEREIMALKAQIAAAKAKEADPKATP